MTVLWVGAQNALWRLRHDEEGQTLIEYALIVSLIGVVTVGALVYLQGKIGSLFSDVGNELDKVPPVTTTTP